MTKPTLHALVLNTLLLLGAAFYLLAPAVFAYVGEVNMTYGRAPEWFARTAPARVTARMFDRYNVNDARLLRLKRQLSCYLDDEGATRMPGCVHHVRSGQSVVGPTNLKIPSGRYTAQFRFGGIETCSNGEARLQVVTKGEFGAILADDTTTIEPGIVIELPFRLHLMDGALNEVEFRLTGISGCVLLRSVDWNELAAKR